jgi:hypothetical protein
MSLSQDILCIELIDHDKGRENLLCILDLPILEMLFGVTTTRIQEMCQIIPSLFPMILNFKYQVTHSDQIPFEDDLFVASTVNVRIQSVEGHVIKTFV